MGACGALGSSLRQHWSCLNAMEAGGRPGIVRTGRLGHVGRAQCAQAIVSLPLGHPANSRDHACRQVAVERVQEAAGPERTGQKMAELDPHRNTRRGAPDARCGLQRSSGGSASRPLRAGLPGSLPGPAADPWGASGATAQAGKHSGPATTRRVTRGWRQDTPRRNRRRRRHRPLLVAVTGLAVGLQKCSGSRRRRRSWSRRQPSAMTWCQPG